MLGGSYRYWFDVPEGVRLLKQRLEPQEMDLFETPRFRLLRLAARFRPTPELSRRSATSAEIASVVNGLMNEGLYADEFAYLDDPRLNYFEMLSITEKFLTNLGWKPLSDEAEFRFLTALYAEIGKTDDVSGYYAICRWIEDVGRELDESFSVKCVADGIEAERIYGCYYSYSNVTGSDLIPSVEDPRCHDWSAENEALPKMVFADWLVCNSTDFDHRRPYSEELLEGLAR